MIHLTDKQSYNVIRSQPDWLFKAHQPPADHPFGVYFTNLELTAPNLAKRLRIPRIKLEYHFRFHGEEGLRPLPGGRGVFIFYSPEDYLVAKERQDDHGATSL